MTDYNMIAYYVLLLINVIDDRRRRSVNFSKELFSARHDIQSLLRVRLQLILWGMSCEKDSFRCGANDTLETHSPMLL